MNKSAHIFANQVLSSMTYGRTAARLHPTNDKWYLEDHGPNHFCARTHITTPDSEAGLYVKIGKRTVTVRMWHDGNTNTETSIIARYQAFADLLGLPISFSTRREYGEYDVEYSAKLNQGVIQLGA